MMMERALRMGPRVAPWMVAAVLAAALSGCGVRGTLENPQNADTKQTATADSGQGKKEGDAPRPHKPFILDGLLR